MAKSPKSISKTHSESSLKRELNNILENRTEGASALESAAFNLAYNVLKSGRLQTISKAKLLQNSFTKIRKRFPLMANILVLCDLVNSEISTIEALASVLQNYQVGVINHRKETIATASEVIGGYDSIFTISNSSMVREAVLRAAKQGWNGSVYVIESRPKNEGILLAKSLAKARINVTVGVDMLMGQFIMSCGAVMLGTDCVTESYFINKIGSSMALDLAKKSGKPVYVVADKSKMISDRKYKFSADKNPKAEVLAHRSQKINIVNQYFEIVKPTGNMRYIYGDKLIRPNRVAELIAD